MYGWKLLVATEIELKYNIAQVPLFKRDVFWLISTNSHMYMAWYRISKTPATQHQCQLNISSDTTEWDKKHNENKSERKRGKQSEQKDERTKEMKESEKKESHVIVLMDGMKNPLIFNDMTKEIFVVCFYECDAKEAR